jgi:rhodanese-related sulfurtransferase
MRYSLILTALVFFLSCKSQPKMGLNADEFEKAIQKENVQVLDVRTAGEFQNGHIKNALQANWNDKVEFSRRAEHVDRNKPVYVYCLAGGRSAAAAKWLRENGYKDVFELNGGMNAWRAGSKPVEGLMAEKQLTLPEFLAMIPNDTVCLVDIGAKWCPPCVKLAPILDEIEKQLAGKMKLIKIDAGTQTELMKELDVIELPGLLIYKNGKQTWKHLGMVSREELLYVLTH